MNRTRSQKKQEEITISLKHIIPVAFIVAVLVTRLFVHNDVKLIREGIIQLKEKKTKLDVELATTNQKLTHISNRKYLIDKATKYGFIQIVNPDTIRIGQVK